MPKEFSIASVTVAFNGAHVLQRHLEALKGQRRRLDEIVVVNNASTDDTSNLLAARFPEVTILNLPENRGMGGGLSAGLAYASLTKKYDWVWIFDQDSVPAENALELLLDGHQQLIIQGKAERTAIVAPVCVHSETGMSYPGLIWKSGWRYVDLKSFTSPVVFVDSVISSGTLLKREVVETMGLPRADFFIDFVDHEYCFRLRRAGYRVAIVKASQLDHEIGSARRIKFFGLSKKWADHVPWREYYMARNEIFTVWKYHPDWRSKCSTMIRLLRHVLELFLFGREKFACVKMMVGGVRDGLAERLGIRNFGAGEDLRLAKAETGPQYGRIPQP
jgi:rhamnosyltransferase